MAGVDAQIRAGADGYAELRDQASRTSVRARVLALLDELRLVRGPEVVTRRVLPSDLARDSVLRGSIVMHLDLVFRSSVTAQEVAITARHGLVLVAEHPQLDGVPVAVVLAAAVGQLAETRRDLFLAPRLGYPDADVVMPYALAASPRGLGAGRALLVELIRECGAVDKPPRITTFSPLTGMRARVMRCVDDSTEWARVIAEDDRVDARRLQSQLLGLLALDRLPADIPDPARSWLRRQATEYARSSSYHVGNFHRSMGAQLQGVLEDADPVDSDALWWRAWFDYGRASTSFGS